MIKNSSYMLHVWSFLGLLLLLFCCSCVPKRSCSLSSAACQSQNSRLPAIEGDSLQDLKDDYSMIPIGFGRVVHMPMEDSLHASTGVYALYKGALAVEQVVLFYRRELEHEGWKFSEFKIPHETILFCSQAARERMIKISEGRQQTEIAIVSYDRVN